MVSPISWTSPRTWVAGETVTAALLNTHIRDNEKAIGDPWTSYTPTWTGTSNPAIGNGTIAGKYMAAGKLIHYRIQVTMGSTTTYGTGNWNLTLPVAPAGLSTFATLGGASGYDSSASSAFMLMPIFNGGSTFILINPSSAGTSATSPFTWASGDILSISGTYEAA